VSCSAREWRSITGGCCLFIEERAVRFVGGESFLDTSKDLLTRLNLLVLLSKLSAQWRLFNGLVILLTLKSFHGQFCLICRGIFIVILFLFCEAFPDLNLELESICDLLGLLQKIGYGIY